MSVPSVRDSADVPEASAEAIARIPRGVAFRYDCLPVTIDDGEIVVAVPSANDQPLIDLLRSTTRLKVRTIVLPRERIRERLRTTYGGDAASVQAMERRAADVPAVRAVDRMYAHAVAAHASDIHVEPHAGGGRIRLRIDGILREVEQIAAELYAPFTSRLKLLAGMDIADKRQPQDGRYTIAHDKREIDARVSSVPTIDGEKIVVRLLDQHASTPSLRELGMPPEILDPFLELVRAPWGFVVVTGPTGSGKTTTLYAALAELDSATRNICSVEDPIEMRVRSVTQVQVNTRAGVTFPAVLRSFMRQDPNVIMVGEMRDGETAAVGISAALAGQLVFTTLHANDAPRTVERLVELGVARHSLAAGLTGIVAQRLVRRLCATCREPRAIPPEIRRRFGIDAPAWHVARGCRACGNIGYIGRVGAYELLVVNDAIREAIAAGNASVHLAHLGRGAGYRPMFDDGLRKVLAGETSFDELTRVVSVGEGRP